MANNCLKTQLKSIVNNNSLSYLGVVRVYVKEVTGLSTYPSFELTTTEETELSIVGGNFITGSGVIIGTTITVNGNTTIVVSNNNATIFIPKYAIKVITMNAASESFIVDINDCSYLGSNTSELKTISVNANGNISALKNVNLSNFSIFSSHSEVEGDISELNIDTGIDIDGNSNIRGKLAKIPASVINIRNTGVQVDLDTITDETPFFIQCSNSGAYGAITKAMNQSNSVLYFTNCFGVNGTLESAIERAWGLGRRSTDCNIDLIGTSVTLNNNSIRLYLKAIFSNNGVEIKNRYDNQETVATYDGSTWTYV